MENGDDWNIAYWHGARRIVGSRLACVGGAILSGLLGYLAGAAEMSLFKFRDSHVCPFRMPMALDQSRRNVWDYKCILPIGHDGVHRSKDGAMWFNSEKLYSDLERAGDPVKRVVFLPNLRGK
jgi:hypothetical protein